MTREELRFFGKLPLTSKSNKNTVWRIPILVTAGKKEGFNVPTMAVKWWNEGRTALKLFEVCSAEYLKEKERLEPLDCSVIYLGWDIDWTFPNDADRRYIDYKYANYLISRSLTPGKPRIIAYVTAHYQPRSDEEAELKAAGKCTRQNFRRIFTLETSEINHIYPERYSYADCDEIIYERGKSEREKLNMRREKNLHIRQYDQVIL